MPAWETYSCPIPQAPRSTKQILLLSLSILMFRVLPGLSLPWGSGTVTFIDDYSRCTSLFLMKNRVELFSIFQKFHAEVRTQFNTSIRILQSDNAKEYLSGPFSSFMSSHGILHQSSCSHTPQQNRVTERKNRHLV